MVSHQPSHSTIHILHSPSPMKTHRKMNRILHNKENPTILNGVLNNKMGNVNGLYSVLQRLKMTEIYLSSTDCFTVKNNCTIV